MRLCPRPPFGRPDDMALLDLLSGPHSIQLFGHKHQHRVQKINDTLRITAGAMHPERDGE